MKVKVEGRKWAILGFVLFIVISLFFIIFCKPSQLGYLRVEKIHIPSENTELTKKGFRLSNLGDR